MNEFTKEELEEIRRCLKYMISGGTTPYSTLTIRVKKKIQTLVDNYCEHDFGNEVYGFVTFRKCHKCGKTEYHEGENYLHE